MVSRVALAEERLQNFLERAAAAKNAGLHGAHADFQNFGHFFVAQAFEITQDDRAAKNVRHLLEGALHGYLNFLRCELIEGRGAQIFDIDLGISFFRLRIDRDIFLQVALEPAACDSALREWRCDTARSSRSCLDGNGECP